MRTATLARYSMLVLSITAVGLGINAALACGQDSTVADHEHLHHHHYAEFAKVPEKAQARANPLEGDSTALQAGGKLFAQHCAECHGSTADGGKRAPSLRVEEVQRSTQGTLFWILTNGVVRRGMPVWSKLPEAQRWQIVSYLKSLGLQDKSHEER